MCYRGSVGDNDSEDVREIELDQIKALLTSKYLAAHMQPPDLTYILVNQKTITRFFTKTENEKPKYAPPGTVVDEHVTLTQQNDFYLISQGAKSPDGATLPVHYNVLRTSPRLDLQTLESLTYKFCHLDYSQLGTSPTPAPHHYAQKLVQFDLKLGLGNEEFFDSKLGHTLHYL
jgi:eukaryotic translation initiation factor 2C